MNEEKPAKEVEEAVIDLIRTRRDVGRKKYGVSMDRGDLSISQWIMHAIEESLDHAIYLEAARRKIVEQDAEIADLRAKLAAIKQAMGHPTTKTLTVGELKTARKAPNATSEYPHCSLCGNGFPYVDSLFGHNRCHKCREEHGTGCSICSNRNCDNPNGKH